MVAMCSHIAPEGMMSGPFYLSTIGPLTVIFVSFLALYVLPLIGNLLIRRGRAGADQAGLQTAVRMQGSRPDLRARRLP